MRLPLSLFAALVLVASLGACGSDDKQDAAGGAPATTAAPAEPAGGCKAAKAPAPKGEGSLRAPRQRLAKGKRYTVRFTTSCGVFDVRLAVARSPKTSTSVASLVRKGFYDNTTFHRIAKGFVIQGGDPKGDGTGGPGYKVTEAPPADIGYTRGVVAMAKTGDEAPGTSGSQFYVVTGEDAGLPPEYALLGRVSKGQDVVALIEGVDTGGAPDGPPTKPVVIEKAELLVR
jgi:peptidyl-prolyl cis-trans isomerase B (cyclophilin B)